MGVDQLVAVYIAARDAKTRLKEKFDTDTAEINGVMDQLEQVFQAYLNQTGQQSAKFGAGTVFRSTVTSVKVSDWDSFITWVKEMDRYDMLNRSANKAAVEQKLEDTGTLPPGIHREAINQVNVRRA